jgi:hypothetical protein
MSARRPTARSLVPFFRIATTPGGAQAAVDRYAPLGELLGDQVRGALLLEAELGMRVEVAAQRGDLRRIGQDGFDDLHGGLRGERPSLPAGRCPVSPMGKAGRVGKPWPGTRPGATSAVRPAGTRD